MGEDVEVAPAVVVVVGPDGAAGPGVGQGHAGGLLGDAEGAVAVVAVQRARALAAGQEQVDPAVVVVVAPGLADAEVAAGEGVVDELGPRAAMRCVDAGGFVRLEEDSRRNRRLRHRRHARHNCSARDHYQTYESSHRCSLTVPIAASTQPPHSPAPGKPRPQSSRGWHIHGYSETDPHHTRRPQAAGVTLAARFAASRRAARGLIVGPD